MRSRQQGLELRERNAEIYKLRDENKKLKDKAFGFNTVQKSDALMNFFTGITSIQVFMWIVGLVKDKIVKCSAKLSIEDHILIVFMKLRLGLLNNE